MAVNVDVELKSSADKYFKALSSEMHKVPTATDRIHGVEVHEGDWESHGSIKFWTYTIDGDLENCKEKVEIDEENKSVKMTFLEGHVLEHYKSFILTFVLIPKDEGSLLKFTLQYDQIINTNFRHPQAYLDWSITVLKDLDEHIVKE